MEALVQPEVYKIQLPQFEGPFDLLLFFIERDELDIHDIPISKITNDFLDYIHQMEALNIEIASEFILVAATLMKIKAKMLLPRPVINEDGEVEDPRTELVNRLLEYKRYKAVLDDISAIEDRAGQQGKRGFTKAEEKYLLKSDFSEEELVGIDLYSIMRTFQNVWMRHEASLKTPKHVIRRYPYSAEQLREVIYEKLQTTEKMDFVSFIMEQPEKVYAVFGFLAALELTQQDVIKVVVGEGFNNFWMVPTGKELPGKEAFDPEVSEDQDLTDDLEAASQEQENAPDQPQDSQEPS